ncbi:MAG TPA: class I SAM-dependent methyltransferase, partial [Rhodothermales bacterium]
MDYDPVKDRLGALFNRSHVSQRAFYRLLDLFFLRAWYVQRELRRIISLLPHDRTIDVLDAGTGFGQYAWHLVRTYPHLRITALDVKEDYLDNARRFLSRTPHADRVTFRLGDLTKLDTVAAYDLVLSVD